MLLCQEKHIDELYLLDRLEQSLAKSYADVLHLDFGARVTIDRATGRVYVYELVPKGEPDEETGEYTEFDEVDVTPPDTSRIAAQHAKAEIKTLVRNAARAQIYDESAVVLVTSSPVLFFSPLLISPSLRFVRVLRQSFHTLTSVVSLMSAMSVQQASVTFTTSASRQLSLTSAILMQLSQQFVVSVSVHQLLFLVPTQILFVVSLSLRFQRFMTVL